MVVGVEYTIINMEILKTATKNVNQAKIVAAGLPIEFIKFVSCQEIIIVIKKCSSKIKQNSF